MRSYKFKKDYTYEDINCKKDTELRINIDNEVINADGEWVFDCDSPYSLEYGVIVNK
jgi:hypothetical protein